MDFPNFVDFLATLDDKTVAGIMKDANIAAKKVMSAPIQNKDDMPGLQVLSISYQVSLELLAVYHKWLEQYF